MAGENLPLVGKPLGHRRHRTTAAYAHVADAHLVAAAEKVGAAIAEAMARAASCSRTPRPPEGGKRRLRQKLLEPIRVILTI